MDEMFELSKTLNQSQDDGGLVAAEKAKADDIAFLRGLTSGPVDIFDESIFPKLEAVFAKYAEDTEMMALANEAAEAYTQATIKAAQSAQGA